MLLFLGPDQRAGHLFYRGETDFSLLIRWLRRVGSFSRKLSRDADGAQILKECKSRF
jgi:hypothetical protein